MCACVTTKAEKIKKDNQQSRSGWGGKRAGAGAPLGNVNAVRHGERSRRAFFPLGSAGAGLSPLVAIRARNLMLVECLGEISQGYGFGIEFDRSEIGREAALICGLLAQHTPRIIRYEKRSARDTIALARAELHQAKAEHKQARAELERVKLMRK